MVSTEPSDEFEEFAVVMRPRLVRALVGFCGVDQASDAASEALLYAFEHWDRVSTMENPGGYLYRVGQSGARQSRAPTLPPPLDVGLPDVEPALVPALLHLPKTQRTAVWLVHACGWSYRETAAAMDISESMVGNHLTRGIESLRRELGVQEHA